MVGNKHHHGFTLLELLVVVALFSLLIVIIADVYLLSLNAQRQSSAEQRALSSVQAAVESMSRSIRSGTVDFSADAFGNTVDSPESVLAILNQSNQTVLYRHDNTALTSVVDGVYYQLTDESVVITNLQFFITPHNSPFEAQKCTLDSECLVSSPGCSASAQEVTVGRCRCSQDTHCRSGSCDSELGLCDAPNQQPRVTISISYYPAGEDSDLMLQTVQTTITSRVYER